LVSIPVPAVFLKTKNGLTADTVATAEMYSAEAPHSVVITEVRTVNPFPEHALWLLKKLTSRGGRESH